MNADQEFQMTYSKIIRIAWIITIIVSAILLVLGLIFNKGDYFYSWTLSYILGTMTNFFAFNILKNNIANMSMDEKSAISGSMSNYFIRFAIYGVVFFIALNGNQEKINAYIVASGYLTIRIAIYIFTFLNRKS